MTKLQITYKPTQDLVAYFNNSRTHSESQINQIVASIEQFGWTNPILLDGKNGVIAGHGRLLAAIKMDAEQVPTIDLAHLTDTQKRAYIIADNKLAMNAGWDEETLANELKDMEDFDLSLLGFSNDELEKYLKENKDDDESDGKETIDESRNILLIECFSETELQKLFDEMKGRGFECKIMS